MIVSQLSGHCDVISNRLWRHQQNEIRAGGTRERCVTIAVLLSFMDSLCRVRNEMMYVLSWQTVSALTPVLLWCLFYSLLCNTGNKHQNTVSCVNTICYLSCNDYADDKLILSDICPGWCVMLDDDITPSVFDMHRERMTLPFAQYLPTISKFI